MQSVVVVVLASFLLTNEDFENHSVLVALPLHELLPEESVIAALVKAIGFEDLREVICHGVVRLRCLAFLTISLLHLLDELLEHLGVLLGEVRLLLALLLVTHVVVDGTEGNWLLDGCSAHKSGLNKRD